LLLRVIRWYRRSMGFGRMRNDDLSALLLTA
jgi:hypothetical protein